MQSPPLDAWHIFKNYYPVPTAPELVMCHTKEPSRSKSAQKRPSRGGSPCTARFESENQFGPGVALIEALNDRDVAYADSWPAFEFDANKATEVIPFVSHICVGWRVSISLMLNDSAVLCSSSLVAWLWRRSSYYCPARHEDGRGRAPHRPGIP